MAIFPKVTDEKTGKTIYYQLYESMEDFWNFSETKECEMAEHERSSRKSDRGGWGGTDTWEHAVNIARNGWPQGLAKIGSLSERLSTCVGQYVRKPEPQHVIAGSYVDVGRFVTGEPECMVEFGEKLERGAGGKLVKICCNIAMSWSVDPDKAFMRGCAMVALVDALETAGLVAEIEACSVSKGDNGHLNIGRIPIKKPGQHIELDRIAYVFANAGMFRRQFFSTWELQDSDFRNCFDIYASGGYGQVEKIPKHLMEEFDLYIPQISNEEKQWHSEEAAIKWVLQHLQKQGLILEGEAVS